MNNQIKEEGLTDAYLLGKYDGIKQGRADKYQEIVSEYMLLTEKQVSDIMLDTIDEVARAMYHQCFECDNDENMQKWDSGNWFRYKLFENVIEQLKEQRINENNIADNTGSDT